MQCYLFKKLMYLMLNKTGTVFKTRALFSFTGLHIFNGSVYLSCAIFNAKRIIWTNRWYQNFSIQGSKIVTKKKKSPANIPIVLRNGKFYRELYV